jgi:hypothetical protein
MGEDCSGESRFDAKSKGSAGYELCSTIDADDQLVIDGKWYHASDFGESVGGLADSPAGGPNDRVPTGDVDRAGKCAS